MILVAVVIIIVVVLLLLIIIIIIIIVIIIIIIFVIIIIIVIIFVIIITVAIMVIDGNDDHNDGHDHDHDNDDDEIVIVIWQIKIQWKPAICLVSFQDIITELGAVSVSAERSKVVDFTLPYYETYITAMITTKPKSSFFVIEPLQFTVWLAYAGMVVVVGVALYIFEGVHHGTRNHFRFPRPHYFFSILWVNCSIMVNQGNPAWAPHNIRFSFNADDKLPATLMQHPITHHRLVTAYGDIDLSQHWLK